VVPGCQAGKATGELMTLNGSFSASEHHARLDSPDSLEIFWDRFFRTKRGRPLPKFGQAVSEARQIEEIWRTREDTVQLDDMVYLYDLTSTYFEAWLR
jgi:hypothetical protein